MQYLLSKIQNQFRFLIRTLSVQHAIQYNNVCTPIQLWWLSGLRHGSHLSVELSLLLPFNRTSKWLKGYRGRFTSKLVLFMITLKHVSCKTLFVLLFHCFQYYYLCSPLTPPKHARLIRSSIHSITNAKAYLMSVDNPDGNNLICLICFLIFVSCIS